MTPPDFNQTIALLQNADEWSSGQDTGALATIAARFQKRIASGEFELSVPLETKLGMRGDSMWASLLIPVLVGQPVDGSEYEFWTSPSAYYYMRDEAPRLLEHLAASSLVIFKGDLK